ncbi:MAG: hypothetical protein WKF91_15495 [Segetibacter sp.]
MSVFSIINYFNCNPDSVRQTTIREEEPVAEQIKLLGLAGEIGKRGRRR